jgi:hypothetical protein
MDTNENIHGSRANNMKSDHYNIPFISFSKKLKIGSMVLRKMKQCRAQALKNDAGNAQALSGSTAKLRQQNAQNKSLYFCKVGAGLAQAV